MPKKRGFTLIELLVVIAIIAILTTIGISSYSGIQSRARDTKRIGDIDAIGKALEVNKSSIGYQPLTGTSIVDGIPTGPKGDQYCLNSGAVKPAAAWGTANCTTLGSGWLQVAPGQPSGDPTQFMVCASLEDSTVFCRSSTQ